MLNNKIKMPKTDFFLKNCLSKKVFDKVEFIDSGYNITKGDKTIYVRLNEKGSALFSSGKELKEVVSARLDNILHRFILSEFIPLQKSTVGDKTIYSTFIPVEKEGNVEFIDSAKNSFKVLNASKEVAMKIYKECLKNSADSAMLNLQNFVSSSMKDEGAKLEYEVITSSFDMENYAVSPCSAYIQDSGKTVVGEFVTSCLDKAILSRFETRLAGEKVPLTSSVKKPTEKELFSSLVAKADSSTITLDSSKEMTISLDKRGVFSSLFKAEPNVEVIQNALYREGLSLNDLENGFTFSVDSNALKSILNSANSIKPVEEKEVMSSNKISHLNGLAVTTLLSSYGIDDQMKVFDKLTKIEIA